MPDAHARALAEWTALLDDFERAVQSDEFAEWRPARHPLPAELAPRARRILAAQHRRVAELTRERDEAAAHLSALRLVPAAPAEHPAYIDLAG
ncbi:hypothetical protein [Microbacterium stercoris]|uniref:Uncharacterized protein n=1 Tax=Microbacterium stercoris TaxID=2820289 RepID=A0A939QKL4_9MICO|nr:hypothetical protein [Microbacterium stercoris]MBO3664609.1 hypothetical protein [Microbacterium stercoris]